MKGTRLPDELLSLGGMAMQAPGGRARAPTARAAARPPDRIEGEWGKSCSRCSYEHYPHLHPA